MTTTLEYTNSIYQTTYDDEYNGVVSVGNGTTGGTGSLLYDGRSILTAAHIFDEDDDNTKVNVYVNTPNGFVTLEGTLKIYEEYDSSNITGDLAIITLDDNLNSIHSRYQIYRDTDEINQNFTMVGYGNIGTGNTGGTSNDSNLKLVTENTFEADMYDIYESSYTNLTWIPEEGTTLAADFDSGSSTTDAFDAILDYSDTGVGDMEGFIASGDSGGPAFIDNTIAGVASYTMSSLLDINTEIDSSYGEIAAWQRVSAYQEWIDKEIRSNFIDAPTSSQDVETSVIESNDSIVYTYFFLEYTADRFLIEDNITLDYTTIDGTAIAGEDFIATSGVITLYSDESSVVIPVEIIGDTIAEPDETFSLEVSNPSYGNFGEDAVTLIAVRTIVDDDGYM